MQALTQDDRDIDVVAGACRDVAEDLESLATMVGDRVAVLREMQGEVRGSGPAIPSAERELVSDAAGWLLARYARILDDLELAIAAAIAPHHREMLAALADSHRRLVGEIRSCQAIAAGVMVAPDWHSPSISHSLYSTAGRYTGRVTPGHDDYKRDRHPDGLTWERRWLSEMVDNPESVHLLALMTASGMAAFTTILAHVLHRAPAGPLVVGRSTYHECGGLLEQSRRPLIEVAEDDESAWRRALHRRPAAVFVDTLCNTADLAALDIGRLIGLLGDAPTYLVIDNTACSVAVQPWKAVTPGRGPRMIVFESLTKHAGLGLDRAAGGVIVTEESEARHLDELREHLGTNIADVVVHQHPIPNRVVLERRLARVDRNARTIAAAVQRRAAASGRRVKVSHPSLASHPAALAGSQFSGGCITIEPIGADPVGFGRAFIRRAVSLAASREVPICEGTSFGLDTTRLYLTSATTGGAAPFLRIAVGTEHRLRVEAVAAVLGDSLGVSA